MSESVKCGLIFAACVFAILVMAFMSGYGVYVKSKIESGELPIVQISFVQEVAVRSIVTDEEFEQMQSKSESNQP